MNFHEFDLRSVLRDIQWGIKNLVLWFLIIWKDRPWDHYYLFVMLRHKLLLMEEYFDRPNPIVVDSKKIAEQIRLCRLLLNRIIKNDYIPNSIKEIKQIEKRIEVYKLADNLAKQDLEMLFLQMKKHVKKWWD